MEIGNIWAILIAGSIILVLALIIAMVIINTQKTNDKTSLRENDKNVIGMIFVVLGGLPIIMYPFVLIANAMSSPIFFEIFTYKSIDEFISGILMILLILLSTFYPLIYIICTVAYFKKKSKRNIVFPIIPISIVIFLMAIISSSY